MKIRLILVAIAAASGSFLAATRLGNNPVTPGAELGIAISITPAGDEVVISHDSADMDAFVELAVAPAGGDSFSAALDNGTPLGITAQSNTQGWFLRVHKAGGAAAASSDKFTWPNGVPIRVRRHVSVATTALRVIDWQVFARDNGSDAAWKARRRSVWRWISLVLMVLSAAGAVLTSLAAAKAPAKTAHSARNSIEALIDEITGKDDEETKALRAFLRRRYIQSASLQESLDATGLSPARARLIGVKARNTLPVRVARLIEDLQNIYVELMKPDVDPPQDNPTLEAPKHG
jgi:hypothetical protein